MTLTVSNPLDLGFDAARLARIDTLLQTTYLDAGRFPHAAVLVGRGDEIAHLSVMGDARPGVPLREDAIFRIASMTKPITSIALMQLVEQGRVALSDPIAAHLPEFANTGVFVSGGGGTTPFVTRPAQTPPRVVDLLRHTSGLTYGFQERSNVDAAYRKSGIERFDSGPMDAFVWELAQLPLEFDPGTAWNYSVATDVVGAIVERVSGQDLDAYFAEHITGPLGMIDTHFQVPADKVDRLPDCYAFAPKSGPDPRMTMYDTGAASAWARKPGYYSGGGGLASTLADYHRFTRMLLNGGELDGQRVLAPHTLKLMTANHLPFGGDLTSCSTSLFSESENAGIGFGLGFAVNIDPAATLVPGNAGEYYWGGIFSTAFFVDPVDAIVMVFMTQLVPSTAYPIRRELKTMIYSALVG